APPNSANWNWSAQSGIQSGDASSATLARAALCACRSCPSLDATSAPGETPRLSGAETSATPDADADRDIHQSPCHSTPAVPQTAWWCHCACSRASSYRTGLFSAAALAASDLTLEFDFFHARCNDSLSLRVRVVHFASATGSDRPNLPDALLVHTLAPQLHSGPAHAEPLGDRHILLTRHRSQDNSAAQRHLLRRPVRAFPLFQLCALRRL